MNFCLKSQTQIVIILGANFNLYFLSYQDLNLLNKKLNNEKQLKFLFTFNNISERIYKLFNLFQFFIDQKYYDNLLNLHTTLPHSQMQQQYFKTMNQANFSSKKMTSPKMIDNNTKNNLNYKNSFRDFDLTDQQATYIKARLPTEFRLIKLNTGQFQKAQEEVRNKFLRTKTPLENFQSNKSKKAVKKIQEKAKHVTQICIEKVQANTFQKLSQPQKQKKIKKHHHSKKIVSQKSQKLFEKKYYNNQQIEQECERSQQQFNIIQQKSFKQIKQGNIQKNAKKKQKHLDENDKQKDKEKKNPKENKQLNKDIIFKEKPQMIQNFQQNLTINQFNSIIKLSTQNQKLYSSPPFPTLPSGLPRHIPMLNDYQPSGSIQCNNLRFLYGLPFSSPINQQINKLNEKQKNFCINIIHKLKAHRSSQAFRVPVDPMVQGVPDYFYVVYNPMDLGTILKKVIKDKYKDISQFHADINLIFQNSYKYNLRSTKYFQAAVEFEDYYQTLLKQALQKPQQYSRQFTTKQLKPRLDSGQLDYTQQTPIKKKKKREFQNSQNFYQINKSQILDNRKIKGKNKSNLDQHSAFYSYSMVNQTNNDFNGQIYMENQNPRFENYHNNPNSMRQQNQDDERNATRLRKVQSVRISKSPIENEAKLVKKEKGKKQQVNILTKTEGQLINLNSKTGSLQTLSVPMQEQSYLSGNHTTLLPPTNEIQIVEQKQVHNDKKGKKSLIIKQKITKQISKGLNNRGKRNLSTHNQAQKDKESEDSDDEYKISKNKQKKIGKEVKEFKQLNQNNQKIQQQNRPIDNMQEQKPKVNNAVFIQQQMNQNMQEYMYNQYMSGYNYYYNQMPPGHYMMINRRINIGSDDDFQQINMGVNMNNYVNDGNMENICHDMGQPNNYHDTYPYQEYFPPNQSERKIVPTYIPAQNNQKQLNYQPNLLIEQAPKVKKRNMMKFPPKEKSITQNQNNFNSNLIMEQENRAKQLVPQARNEDDQDKKQQGQRDELQIKSKQKIKQKIQKKKNFQEGETKIKVEADRSIIYSQQIQAQQQNKIQQNFTLIKKSNKNTKKGKLYQQQQQYIPQYPYYQLGCQNIASNSQYPNVSHQNITINNINQHPPVYPQRLHNLTTILPQNQNIDINMIIQKNTEHQNYSGSTVASNVAPLSKYPLDKSNPNMNSTIEALPSVAVENPSINQNKIKSKIKNKRKRDEQYEYESDDQYNMEEEWRMMRRNYIRPAKKAKPKIHKQKSKESNSQDYVQPKRGRNNRKNKSILFDKNNLNLSNTQLTHQMQIRQNTDKQLLSAISHTNNQAKMFKIQQQISPKNIFIESERQSSHFSKHALDLQDYMGILVDEQEIKEHDKNRHYNHPQYKQIIPQKSIKDQSQYWQQQDEQKYDKDGSNQANEYLINQRYRE